ncbi:hypothetical protein ACER0C_016072 [Sarotherodon galilaeus]
MYPSTTSRSRSHRLAVLSLSHRAATDSTQTPREITQSAAGLSSQKIKRKRRERRTDRVWRRRWSLRKSPSPSSEAPPFRGSALERRCCL